MKKDSLSKNFILQLFYQILILLIPLILSPYLTRTLQENALGIYSYSNSIAYYFVVFSLLGISRHGQRIISQTLNEENKLRKTFWSLFFVHVVISLICTLLYIIFVVYFVKNNKLIFIIQTFYVLSALFDITWFFYGIENFRNVVFKNTIVKMVECLLIFLLVKTPADLWKYCLITSLGIMIGQLVMIPSAMRIVKPIKFSKYDAIQHIKPLLFFSISVIAVSLYTVFDKTLLGILTPTENVAFYDYSNRIVAIPKTIIGVIGTVMFPRACKMAREGNVLDQKKYIQYSIVLTSFISMGSIFGLFAVGSTFAELYYGASFKICGPIIMSLSPIIYIIGIGDILRTQYMIPNHMDKQFNICILLNALVNIVLSISLIPIFGIYGAVIGTVCAELFGMVYQLFLCNKFIKMYDIFIDTVPFLLIGSIMFVLLFVLNFLFPIGIKGLILEICIGMIIYISLSLTYLFIFKKDFLSNIIRNRQ